MSNFKNINANNLSYTTAESAYNAGELFYKKKLINPETGTEFWQARPIFIVGDTEKKPYVSIPYLYKFFQRSERCICLKNSALKNQIRYIYKNGVYQIASSNDIKSILTNYIENFNIKYLTTTILNQTFDLIDCTCDTFNHDAMNVNEDIINFQNGILNIRTLEMSKHTTSLMSSIQIPCNWNGNAVPTPVFDKFLATLTSNEPQTGQLLMEYMGAVLSNVQGWRFKKAMFIHGKGDTGKSTIINLLCRLLGAENICERDLKGLNERFGETAAYNKRLIYSNDLSFMKIEENALFKNLTGGDTISIEFKNKDPFDYKFKGFLLYGMNDLPKFGGDKGDHVYNRIIIVECKNVIPKSKFDRQLESKLYAEREGIVYKCIMAFRKALIDNDYNFSITQDCINSLKEYKKENSLPVEFWTSYVEETPLVSPVLGVQNLYNNFRSWCVEQGITRISTLPEFKKEISNFLGKDWNSLTKRTKKGMYFISHKLNNVWNDEHFSDGDKIYLIHD